MKLKNISKIQHKISVSLDMSSNILKVSQYEPSYMY